ncbi:PH domain-containing protein [Saccharomonospora glauca]|jgi:hypothetical protein|uniref:Low molecular weight protein antigen 6 PH domain-containing protein n=1 Tax=Saccharomonospora glauca K62 TaxID=928724 RepID=I1CYX9_9PSEU|nr:PH domain-containing protein [Saccharomonospora glauca]EIE97903.1 Protein of unknown function (DUF2581) [Saccharomonospora glauca K62]
MTATRRDDNADTGTDTDTRERGHRAVFRVPGTALIGVLMLFMCMFPFAAALPYLLVLLLVPIVLAVWIVRTRTTATREGLTVRTLLGTRDVPWDAIKGFTITPKSTVVAVLTDDTTVPLPSVRTRHLPVLSLVSEGRVPDPSGVLDSAEETDSAEPKTDGQAGREAGNRSDAEATTERSDDTEGR